MAKGLRIAEPPRRRESHEDADAGGESARSSGRADKFEHLSEDAKVQFNKRVTRRTADGFDILSTRTRRKVPDLLAEALEMLEEKYGRV